MKNWSRPATGPADYVVAGDDRALAAAAVAHPGALFAFEPDSTSDVARNLGLDDAAHGGNEVELDVLRVGDRIAVNAIVIGTAPRNTRWWSRSVRLEVVVDGARAFAGNATGIVVSTGEHLHGDDMNPRSHPADGRAEVYVFSLGRGERRAMRRRLATGTHVPHPRILRRPGRVVTVTAASPVPLEVDGVVTDPTRVVEITVEPGALRLLI